MAWTAPLTAGTNDTLTAAQFNSNVRDNLLETEVAKVDTAYHGNFLGGVAANSIVERKHAQNWCKEISSSVTSTTYTSVDVGAPSVSLTTGTTALCFLGASIQIVGSAILFGAASVAVSGASTVAASDAWSIQASGMTASNERRYTTCHRFTGLTAGVNTFTMQYKVETAASGNFSNREILVIAL